MGPRSIRITGEDFLIPREFRDYRLAERSTAQIGGVRLVLVDSGGRTAFGSCYQQVPLRVMPPFHLGDEPAALVYLLNPTVGLMDGDGHLVEIEAQAGICAVVTGQSAARVHRRWRASPPSNGASGPPRARGSSSCPAPTSRSEAAATISG